jgi:hypothetical protein
MYCDPGEYLTRLKQQQTTQHPHNKMKIQSLEIGPMLSATLKESRSIIAIHKNGLFLKLIIVFLVSSPNVSGGAKCYRESGEILVKILSVRFGSAQRPVYRFASAPLSDR